MIQRQGEAVHHLTLGPKAVAPTSTLVGQSRETTLESIPVQIRYSRLREVDDRIGWFGTCTADNVDDSAGASRDARGLVLLVSQQRGSSKNHFRPLPFWMLHLTKWM